jgi:hypothetical protein
MHRTGPMAQVHKAQDQWHSEATDPIADACPTAAGERKSRPHV